MFIPSPPLHPGPAVPSLRGCHSLALPGASSPGGGLSRGALLRTGRRTEIPLEGHLEPGELVVLAGTTGHTQCLSGPSACKEPGPCFGETHGKVPSGLSIPKGRGSEGCPAALPPHAHRAPPAPALCFSKELPAPLSPQHLTCGDRTSGEPDVRSASCRLRAGVPGSGLSRDPWGSPL